MKTITELVSKSSISEGLIRAVVRQAGGWDTFQKIAPTVIEGMNKELPGFEYHTETAKFFMTYRDFIRQLANHTAETGGQSTIKMIHNLHYLDKSFTEDEIGIALYGPKSKIDIQIANALAWFALEKVAQAYLSAVAN